MGNRYANAITGLRLVIALFVMFSIIGGNRAYSVAYYLLALITDLLDGFIARLSNSSSKQGAFYDAGADFVLVFAGFLGLVVTGVLPFWVLILAVFMFMKFVSGFDNRNGIYDVYGKRFGILSLLVTPICLLSPCLLTFVYRPLVVLASMSTVSWMGINPLVLIQKGSNIILDRSLFVKLNQLGDKLG